MEKLKQDRYHEFLARSLWPLWGILLIVICWRSFWTSSLWLDESLSWFVASSSWSELSARAVNFQGQSPFYFALLKVWTALFGSAEWVMRSLSGIFAIAALYPLWHIGKRIANNNFAHTSVLLLLASDQWQRSFSARPYALAFFCSVSAIWIFIKWLDTNRAIWGLAALSALIAASYAHYLFVPTLGVLILLVILSLPDANNRPSSKSLTGFLAIYLLSLYPAVAQLAGLYSQRALLTIREPELSEMLKIALPPMAIASVCCAIAIGLIFWRTARVLPHRGKIWLLWLWWGIGGPLSFYLLSLLSGAGLVGERYLLWALPGSVFLLAQVVAAIEPISARKRAIVALAILLLFGELARDWRFEDWRTAQDEVRAAVAGAEVSQEYIYSGLVETTVSETFDKNDPLTMQYLASPALYYNSSPSVRPLPANLEGAAWKQLREQIIKRLSEVDLVTITLLDHRVGESRRTTSQYYTEFLTTAGLDVRRAAASADAGGGGIVVLIARRR